MRFKEKINNIINESGPSLKDAYFSVSDGIQDFEEILKTNKDLSSNEAKAIKDFIKAFNQLDKITQYGAKL